MDPERCDLCGEVQNAVYLHRSDRFSGELFTYLRCENCGLIYLSPQPDQESLVRYYPPDYEAYQYSDASSRDLKYLHRQRTRKLQLAFTNRYASPPGRLLDVGCGTGEFMAMARETGWEVSGIELIPTAIEIARSHYNLEVHQGALEDVPLADRSLDVITMWDVLEHLPSPKTSVKRCYELLKPGGVLVFSIPNFGSYDHRIFGENWIGWDAPRHFYMFNRASLDRLLGETGYQVEAKATIFGAKGAFQLSLDFAVRDSPVQKLVGTVAPLISLLLWPYRQIAYRTTKAPILTVAASKPLPLRRDHLR